jgi:outer membrane receptor protein involved in Fe transport
MLPQIDPYQSQTQSRNLRVIESELAPIYRARNDTLEFNAEFEVSPTLAFVSQTGYSKDRLYSTEDFNRFNTRPNIFTPEPPENLRFGRQALIQDGQYCDPQLGCSSRLVGQDLSQERAWQFSQEARLTSNLAGPFNFSVGANYLHYQTTEDYFVFVNLLSMISQKNNKAGVGDFSNCYPNINGEPDVILVSDQPYFNSNGLAIQGLFGCNGGSDAGPGTYIDPNPLSQINGNGHNYFRSQNPYRLNSFAGFGEVYYQITPDVKLTGGLRWTDDNKRFWNIPSWLLLEGGGFLVQDVIDQSWKEWTGRFNVNWTPKLDFTDQTMVYASYARGDLLPEFAPALS